MELSATDFAHVRDLYNRGCYRQALDASAGFGPLRDWKGAPGRVLAACGAGFLVWAVVLGLLVGDSNAYAPGIFVFAPR